MHMRVEKTLMLMWSVAGQVARGILAPGSKLARVSLTPHAVGAAAGAALAAAAISGARFAGPRKDPGGGTFSTNTTRPSTAESAPKRRRDWFPTDDSLIERKRRRYGYPYTGRTFLRFDQRKLPWL